MSSRGTQLWYDRQGEPITQDQAQELRLDRSYVVVAAHVEGGFRVSTIWLGRERGWGRSELPVVFETMIISPDGYEEHCERSATEAGALAAHDQAVTHLRTCLLRGAR